MSAFKGEPKVPCASLLIRIVNPPQRAGKLLSSTDVPKDQWEETGVLVKTPPYGTAVYMNRIYGVPTKAENAIFYDLLSPKLRKHETIRGCLVRAAAVLLLYFSSSPPPLRFAWCGGSHSLLYADVG
jgi:hypothetical protein